MAAADLAGQHRGAEAALEATAQFDVDLSTEALHREATSDRTKAFKAPAAHHRQHHHQVARKATAQFDVDLSTEALHREATSDRT
jgi:hypothetical protein